ncbi:hypothetical protein P3G55_26720, partial [Leptospira sp. 96542]|nr:hypothetical protein [Leptospira sp. 96542]
SAASAEQNDGVARIGDGVGQMEEATRLDAMLVKEMNEVVGQLHHQAQEMIRATGLFRMTLDQHPAAPRPPSSQSRAQPPMGLPPLRVQHA